MSWTQTQLDELEAAIAAGVLSVGHGDKRVQYRSLDDMLRVRDIIRRSLGYDARPSYGLAAHDKALADAGETDFDL